MDLSEPLHKRVLRWGNSYGIRLTRSELDALQLEAGDTVEVEVRPRVKEIDWDHLPRFSFGPDASVRHDEILAEGWARERR